MIKLITTRIVSYIGMYTFVTSVQVIVVAHTRDMTCLDDPDDFHHTFKSLKAIQQNIPASKDIPSVDLPPGRRDVNDVRSTNFIGRRNE